MKTPWGDSQTVEKISDGLYWVSTASHGGIKVSSLLDSRIRIEWRTDATRWAGPGWYEEDCCWAYVALTFPEHFTAKQLDDARATVKFLEKERS